MSSALWNPKSSTDYPPVFQITSPRRAVSDAVRKFSS